MNKTRDVIGLLTDELSKDKRTKDECVTACNMLMRRLFEVYIPVENREGAILTLESYISCILQREVIYNTDQSESFDADELEKIYIDDLYRHMYGLD